MGNDNKDNKKGIANGAIPGIAQTDKSRGRVAAVVHNPFAGAIGAFWGASFKAGMDWWNMALSTPAAALQFVKETQKLYQQSFTRADIEKWVEIDFATHTKDNGTSPGGRYYNYTKVQMQALLDRMPPLFKDAYKKLLKDDPFFQETLRGDAMAKQFASIDDIIRDVYTKKHPECAASMRWQGTLRDQKYNHKFLTETSRQKGDKHGEIVAMDVDAIVELFHKPAASGKAPNDPFPHIIVTSSHAQGETLRDVMSITHGIEAMARDSEGKELPHGYIDKGVKPGQTLTIYACDVGKTPWKNGAALLRRVNELKRIAKTGEPDREFTDVSPGAKRIAKLILKCMAEEPSLIDVDNKQSMSEIAAHRMEPIRLRADAVDIAHHFQLIGYSKGGNVVSDAMRYLVAELTAKRADGQDVFAKHPESPTRNGDCSMSQQNVRNVVRSIACMALASVEVGMSEHDKKYGVRRVSINNQHDLISAHHNFEGSLHDERWIIHGAEEHHGHAPHQMMGSRAPTEDVALSEEFSQRGYAHEDPRVARRLKEFFAANFQKAAISAVLFPEDKNTEVLIEAATGTTDAQLMERSSLIKRELMAAGLRNVNLAVERDNPGFLRLQCNADFKRNPRDIQSLKHALLRLKHDPHNKLVVAQSMVEQLDQQIIKAGGGLVGNWAPRDSRAGRAA